VVVIDLLSFLCGLLFPMVLDNLAFDHENDIFGNVCGKVGDTFQIIGNSDEVERTLYSSGISRHECYEFSEYLCL